MKFTFFLFDNGVCLPFNKENELNFKQKQKSNHEKLNFSVNKLQDFFLEKKQKTDIRVLTAFITLKKDRIYLSAIINAYASMNAYM